MFYKVKILAIRIVTHDVKSFILSKPANFKFDLGQAVNVYLDIPGFEDKIRPFTLVSSNEDQVLELIIKCYDEHNGVTSKMHKMVPGDEINISDPWGAMVYNGPGLFIAGGTGITPFISIFRSLWEKGEIKGNKLIFSNKTASDIILEKELRLFFSEEEKELFLTLTNEKKSGYLNGMVDKDFLKNNLDNLKQNFYLCGPPPMTLGLSKILKEMGAETKVITFS